MEDNTFSLCDEVKVSSEGLGRWVVKPNMSRIPGPDGFTMPLLPTTHLQLGWFNLDFLVSRFSPELSRWSQVFFSQSTSAKRRKGWLALVIAVSCYKKRTQNSKAEWRSEQCRHFALMIFWQEVHTVKESWLFDLQSKAFLPNRDCLKAISS